MFLYIQKHRKLYKETKQIIKYKKGKNDNQRGTFKISCFEK
jgi:hypothetical protein